MTQFRIVDLQDASDVTKDAVAQMLMESFADTGSAAWRTPNEARDEVAGSLANDRIKGAPTR